MVSGEIPETIQKRKGFLPNTYWLLSKTLIVNGLSKVGYLV